MIKINITCVAAVFAFLTGMADQAFAKVNLEENVVKLLTTKKTKVTNFKNIEGQVWRFAQIAEGTKVLMVSVKLKQNTVINKKDQDIVQDFAKNLERLRKATSDAILMQVSETDLSKNIINDQMICKNEFRSSTI
jgi:hypothetical protein